MHDCDPESEEVRYKKHFTTLFLLVAFLLFVFPPLSYYICVRENFVCSMKSLSILAGLAAVLPTATACGASGHSDSCYGPINHVEHVRHVKRMQPGAQGASYGPSRPLEWGQLNVMHTVCSRS